MNLQTERIGQFCKQLKLERVAAEYAVPDQSAVRDEASFTDFLETVLKAESDFRTERTRQMLAKLAVFPAVKTLEAFDFGFAVGVPKALIQELATLVFIERTENVVLLGASWGRQDPFGDRAGPQSHGRLGEDPVHHRRGSDAAAAGG